MCSVRLCEFQWGGGGWGVERRQRQRGVKLRIVIERCLRVDDNAVTCNESCFMEPTVTGGYIDSNRWFKQTGQAH